MSAGEKGPCYTLGDGSCVSPFNCIHGPGIDMESLITDKVYLDWLENNLVYAIVTIIGFQSVSLPSRGRGWRNGELREAINRAIEAQNEYQAKLDKK